MAIRHRGHQTTQPVINRFLTDCLFAPVFAVIVVSLSVIGECRHDTAIIEGVDPVDNSTMLGGNWFSMHGTTPNDTVVRREYQDIGQC